MIIIRNTKRIHILIPNETKHATKRNIRFTQQIAMQFAIVTSTILIFYIDKITGSPIVYVSKLTHQKLLKH